MFAVFWFISIETANISPLTLLKEDPFLRIAHAEGMCTCDTCDFNNVTAQTLTIGTADTPGFLTHVSVRSGSTAIRSPKQPRV